MFGRVAACALVEDVAVAAVEYNRSKGPQAVARCDDRRAYQTAVRR